nr:disintegrin and metalloproteinase domain-containing protein 1a-like [Vicugna pacos]
MEQAECSDGLCCVKCQLQPRGFMCRPALGECDLPEYCDGSSGECPQDSYKQDGTLCERIYYCAGGRCKNPDNQCMDIFGFSARSAPENCYISRNSKGDRFGNCGITNSPKLTYLKCADDDVFCGKLICTNVRQLPPIKPSHTLMQIPHKNDFCWSMDAYNITDIPDDGDVHTGTLCAPHKVCMNHLCTDNSVLMYNCEPMELCNGKGVCNNLRHCHCEAGYAPPNCRDPGNGGSVDSGPPTALIEIQSGDVSDSPMHRSVDFGKISKIIFILPAFLLLFLLIAIFCISIRTGLESVQTPGRTSEDSSEETSSEVFIMEFLPVGIQEDVPEEGSEAAPPPEEAPPPEVAPQPEEAPPPEAPPPEAPQPEAAPPEAPPPEAPPPEAPPPEAPPPEAPPPEAPPPEAPPPEAPPPEPPGETAP